MHSPKQRPTRITWSGIAVAVIAVCVPVAAQAQTPSSRIDQTYVGRQVLSFGETRSSNPIRVQRASEIIGMSVRTPGGDNVGQIQDLVVDTGNGNLRYAMLRFDPGFFSGERLFAVPVDRLSMAWDHDDLVLSGVTREQLERAAIDRSVWNDSYFSDLSRVTRLDSAWGEGSRTAKPVALVSRLLDRRVLTSQGRRAGELEELVIDMDRAQVHYAVVDFDRGWLSSDRSVLMPLTALKLEPTGREARLNLDRKQIDSMPDFERQQ